MMAPTYKNHDQISGFTLVEILVGISLSLVVLGGVLAVYIPTLQSWRVTTSLAEIQDTEAILHDTFGTSIRQAGIIGCGNNTRSKDNITPFTGAQRALVSGWAFPSPIRSDTDTNNFVTADHFLANTLGVFPANASDTALNNAFVNLNAKRLVDSTNTAIGDVFYTLTPSTGFYRINSAASTSTLIQVENNVSINAGEFFVVNTCDASRIVRAIRTNRSGQINFASATEFTVPPDNTVVNRFNPVAYYLGSFTANSDESTTIPTLYRRTISQALTNSGAFQIIDTPISTGIENLRLQFGVSAGGDFIVNYQTAHTLPSTTGNIADLSNVTNVKVHVMIRASSAGTGSSKQSLRFPDINGHMVDCYLDTDPDPSACPSFVTDSPTIPRKVITFTYVFPHQAAIIHGA